MAFWFRHTVQPHQSLLTEPTLQQQVPDFLKSSNCPHQKASCCQHQRGRTSIPQPVQFSFDHPWLPHWLQALHGTTFLPLLAGLWGCSGVVWVMFLLFTSWSFGMDGVYSWGDQNFPSVYFLFFGMDGVWCIAGVIGISIPFTSWFIGMDGVYSWGDWNFHSVYFLVYWDGWGV